MALDIYTGTLGSGKSLDTTLEIYKYLESGRNVIANYPINIDEIKRPKKAKNTKNEGAVKGFTYVKEDALNVRFLIDYHKKNHKKGESQTLLVIDEGAMYFNARTWNEKERMLWLKFFKHSRKLGYDCIVITQAIGDIDKQLRALFDYNVIHRKLSHYKMFKWLAWLGITVFVKVYVWLAIDKKDHSEFFIYKPKYSKLYDTLDLFMDIDEMFPELEEEKQPKAA